MITLLISCVVAAIGVYVAIVTWPQRIPKDRTVSASRRRIDQNETYDYR
ncbi:hypothetical protein NONO_c48520 [Nocardia nova SH22a]|uniref:Uncharacterized protein n=1 Tax=Nocardia nova SH22a TaxID=1415166 RepID=W5TQW4_9NOCA|nr:hypothetical protein [Nocardia nova]AHH19636.1 hypothetical protein NONO_c48520 [Nocardia nova SH22a]